MKTNKRSNTNVDLSEDDVSNFKQQAHSFLVQHRAEKPSGAEAQLLKVKETLTTLYNAGISFTKMKTLLSENLNISVSDNTLRKFFSKYLGYKPVKRNARRQHAGSEESK